MIKIALAIMIIINPFSLYAQDFYYPQNPFFDYLKKYSYDYDDDIEADKIETEENGVVCRYYKKIGICLCERNER